MFLLEYTFLLRLVLQIIYTNNPNIYAVETTNVLVIVL